MTQRTLFADGQPLAMKHIVATSGGKDSTAMALRLREIEPRDYEFAITPTGDELPDMKAHWRHLGQLLGKPLLWVGNRITLKQLNKAENAIPNWRMRFCTKNLKIIPWQQYVMDNRPATTYVGLRADEEGRAGIEWDDPDITLRYPLREWGWNEADVWAYLEKHHVTIPPRTDCARCFYQTLYEWYLLYKNRPGIYEDAVQEERYFQHTYRSPQRDTWPAALADLRCEFEHGRIPKQRRRTGGCRVCTL